LGFDFGKLAKGGFRSASPEFSLLRQTADPPLQIVSRDFTVNIPSQGEDVMAANQLRGRTALVTGGSRGIGAAVARALAEAGASVAINYRERADEAGKLADGLRKTGARVIAVAADVSQAEAVKRMVETVGAEFGAIDILVNNAGIAITRGIDDLTEADFDQTIAVNLKSVFLCTQAVLPLMRTRKWGRIVNISSGAARGAGAIGPHYNASKAGMEGLTRGYAARLVKEGITVNAVAPSLIETDMMKGQDSLVGRIPLGRFGTTDEVAIAVMMLIDNAYMTGQTIAMSGGMAFN
jgi:3-oxoacyl-[acyl-carrier protein] reductase